MPALILGLTETETITPWQATQWKKTTMKALNLNMKALYFCVALICIAVANFFFQVHSINSQKNLATLTTTSTELVNDIANLQLQADTYVNNAPRDYESYFRDVALYHKQFNQAVDTLQNHNILLKNASTLIKDDPVTHYLFPVSQQHLLQASQMLTEGVDLFITDYRDQIGENEAEPRLEWAAQSITRYHGDMSEAAAYFANQLELWQQQQTEMNRKLGYGIAGILFVSALLFSFWFIGSVVLRIRRTAVACDRVANGDFGYQIPANNNDEISQMTRSFNSVSERFKLVLSLLDQLNDSSNSQQAIDAIMAICANYFSIHWSGLVVLQSDDSIRLEAANPLASMRRWSAKSAKIKGNNVAGIMQEHIRQHKPWIIEDLDKFSVSTSDSRFLRELIRNTHSTTLFGIPLSASDAKGQGMLILASRDKTLVEGKRAELLFKLSPLIGSRLMANTDRSISETALEPAQTKAPQAPTPTQKTSEHTIDSPILNRFRQA
ncbi:Alginate biosynthesis sensor protein KinB [BD1-7 clade bacterium]|uniref:Alginate biosynthesis sensor protein KinB n=1 Tax=BD1-7 clade bacterium TaxID=2029982 RepID=A0A5S9PI33_9GAMM|nr:Alginate biosynthesis sensor protein KinB [BD1-7 clade bacterium]CAA0103828.1 Alginate biosynthesis sensor protein KinB [BD1-7 clade bacterium]